VLASPARAEDGMEVKANVPFSFYAGDEKLPAGNYVFTLDDASSPTVLVIDTPNGKRHEFVLTEGERDTSGPANRSELVFDHYGQDHFLAEVRVEGLELGRELPETNRERSLAMSMSKDRVTVHLEKKG
jgi:hypothetical protein